MRKNLRIPNIHTRNYLVRMHRRLLKFANVLCLELLRFELVNFQLIQPRCECYPNQFEFLFC